MQISISQATWASRKIDSREGMREGGGKVEKKTKGKRARKKKRFARVCALQVCVNG